MYTTEYRAELMANRLCISCKGENATEGARCEKCAKKNSANAVAIQRMRWINGLCVSCGDPHEGAVKKCDACRESAAKKRRVVHHESRRFVQCGRPSVAMQYTDDPSRVTCRLCKGSMRQ